MSRKKKKPETFLQKKVHGFRKKCTFWHSVGRNRKRIGKAFSGLCEVAARVMEKKL